MSIDEAIANAREVTEIQRKICETHIFFDNVTFEEFYADDTEIIENALYEHKLCAEEHEQLAKWLEELKAIKSDGFTDDLLNMGFSKGYEKGRNDAIEEIHTDLTTEIAMLNATDMTDVNLYTFAVRIKEITDSLINKIE